MSSENLNLDHAKFYQWTNTQQVASYIFATYEIITNIDPELAALALAKEQSVVNLDPNLTKLQLERISASIARVVSVKVLSENISSPVVPYSLNTTTYPRSTDENLIFCEIKIAYPISNFGLDLTQLLNFVAGESHRLGFLLGVRLVDLDFPDSYLNKFMGPKYGIKGIYEKLAIKDRPIFCRSTRPAVGYTTNEIVESHYQALLGGFDIAKDDELAIQTSFSDFKERVVQMMDMIKRVQDQTGEQKLFIANLICDYSQLNQYCDFICEQNVPGVLLSPGLQGISIISHIAKQTNLAILAHNTFADCFTRHPYFGIANNVYHKLARIAGADFLMMPAEIATSSSSLVNVKTSLNSAFAKFGDINKSLPILAGGKTADCLSEYFKEVGAWEFMLIVASAVDHDPSGAMIGAKKFREAWENRCLV